MLFGERDVERVSDVSIKQRGSTDRCVAGRQLLLYNFNDSVVVTIPKMSRCLMMMMETS